MDKQKKIQIFEEAFSCQAGHSCFECNCGAVFYNSNGSWDWEEGHLEELTKSNATDLDYSVEDIKFEGKYYCKDCNCWHERALKVFGFLLSHNWQIIDLYKLVKKQKAKEVDDIKTMEKGIEDD